VLRFWETKFSFIRPMKRAGGRRFYRPQDLMVLKGLRVLLHDDGYTIKGVQRLHKELGIKRLLSAAHGGVDGGEDARALAEGFDQGVTDQAAQEARESGARAEPSQERLRGALQALEAAKARLARALADH
jgi:DNA-binding transcriptional MerR regulator